MQQYCIKWNNHMRNFQLTLPKYFQNQKFLDCNLLVEGHLVPCHKFVLDACSDYFASFLKNKLLDDRNVVICLPKEIRLWEVQALLQFMYHGEVCISQEGLSSLVKCAEMLQVKGLCGNETASIVSKDKDASPAKTKQNGEVEPSASEMIEIDVNEASDCCEFNDQMIIKREIHISDVDSPIDNEDDEPAAKENAGNSIGLIRVKRNLFENDKDLKNLRDDEASNSLVYNKKSMDIYVKPTSKDSEMDASSSRCSTPLLVEQQQTDEQQFENIVCSPSLVQYHYMTDNKKARMTSASVEKADNMDEYDDDDDDDEFIEEATACSNDTLYNMIAQKFDICGDDNDSELSKNLLISSVGSLNQKFKGNEVSKIIKQSPDTSNNEMKVAIGGLYLRNPRGNQVRQYDVNALYSALQDVKNGHSIYRAAQTYSIPRKTLRNWMKRLHIKSQFPMPKQLAAAAKRKKNSQVKGVIGSNIILNAIELS